MADRIPIEKWSKDHWSLLAYIETCCVDQNNHINYTRIRVNPETHPLLAIKKISGRKWQPGYGTVLSDKTVLPRHDDVDCMDDLDKAGLISIISLINGVVTLTPWGIEVSQQLRRHKIEGKQYRDFKISPPPIEIRVGSKGMGKSELAREQCGVSLEKFKQQSDNFKKIVDSIPKGR